MAIDPAYDLTNDTFVLQCLKIFQECNDATVRFTDAKT